MLGTDDNRTDHCWLMLCSIFLPSISLFFGRLKQRPLKGSVYFLSRSQSFNLGWYHKYLISLSSKKKILISLIFFFSRMEVSLTLSLSLSLCRMIYLTEELTAENWITYKWVVQEGFFLRLAFELLVSMTLGWTLYGKF